MCGVYVEFGESIKPGFNKKIQDQIDLRGKDGNNSIESRNLKIYFSRLSFVAPESPIQPIELETGSILVCNGEIYNYLAISNKYLNSKQLAGLHGLSDMHYLAKLIESQGFGVLREIDGMFAGVFINKKNEELIAFRDFVGEKPLYYSLSDKQIKLSSSLMALAISEGEVSTENFFSFWLQFGQVPIGKTLFDQILELPPGHILKWKSGKFELEKYWQWPKNNADSTQVELKLNGFKRSIENSFELIANSVPDAPIAISGGLDSQLLLSLQAKYSQTRKLVHIKFNKSSYDESDQVKKMLSEFSSDFELQVIEFSPSKASNLIETLLQKMDSPCADPAVIAFFFLINNLDSKTRAIIVGDGGDELFRGYEAFKHINLLLRLLPLLKKITLVPGYKKIIEFTLWNLRAHNYLGTWQKFLRLACSLHLPANLIIANAISPNFAWSFLSKQSSSNSKFYINSARDLEVFFREQNLPQLFLQKTDRSSMIEGVEVRAPLLSRSVIENAAQLIEVKDRARVYSKLFESVSTKKTRKHGFGVPLTEILDHFQPKDDYLLDGVGIDLNLYNKVMKNRNKNVAIANLCWSFIQINHHLNKLHHKGVILKNSQNPHLV